jgi:uncharacterized protein YgiB involved in biofilm formation
VIFLIDTNYDAKLPEGCGTLARLIEKTNLELPRPCAQWPPVLAGFVRTIHQGALSPKRSKAPARPSMSCFRSRSGDQNQGHGFLAYGAC